LVEEGHRWTRRLIQENRLRDLEAHNLSSS
jgi:hypothetical protein